MSKFTGCSALRDRLLLINITSIASINAKKRTQTPQNQRGPNHFVTEKFQVGADRVKTKFPACKSTESNLEAGEEDPAGPGGKGVLTAGLLEGFTVEEPV